jgi:hypothetical protein
MTTGSTFSPAMKQTAIGLFVGAFVPIAGFFLLQQAGSNDAERSPDSSVAGVSEQAPGQLVASALPQVAVMGHQEAEGGLTEVLIQIPGIPGHQSVFVLPDSETLIAGRIVTPGGSPYGIAPTASVGVDSPQQAAMMKSVGSVPQVATPDSELMRQKLASAQDLVKQLQPIPEGASSPAYTQDGEIGSSVADDDIPLPPSAQSPSEDLAEVVPETEQPSIKAPSQRVADAPVTRDEAPDSAATASSVEPADSAEMPAEKDAFSGLDLTGLEDFQSALRTMVKEDPQLVAISSQTSDEGQQEAYYEAVTSMPAITQGDGNKDLYVFFDPNCPVCHSLYAELAVDVAAGNLTVHWIPAVVFANQPSSVTASALLLESIQNNEDGLATTLGRLMTRETYIDQYTANYPDTNNEYLQQAVRNTALMAIARPETPLLVFLAPDRSLSIERGIPAAGLLDRIAERED